MPVTLSRLTPGRFGAKYLNAIIAQLEAAMNGALPATYAIAAVTGLQAALDAKAADAATTAALALKATKIIPTYTVATVPVAADNAGVLIRVSDGDDGDPCLALSSGAAWLRIVPGAAVAAGA